MHMAPYSAWPGRAASVSVALTVAESLSQELVFLCEGKEPASPRTGGTSFQAEGAAGAKAPGQGEPGSTRAQCD